jgi:hypothetical protein
MHRRFPGMTQEEEPRAEVTKTEARQGVELNSMRYVLGFGIAGVVACFLLLLYVFGALDN